MRNEAVTLDQFTEPNEEVTKQVEEKKLCCTLTKKVKIIIGVIIGVLVLAGVGLGVGLHFTLRTKIIQERPVQPVIFDDGSQIVMSQLILNYKEGIFKPRKNLTVYKSEIVSSGRRMLQNEEESDTKFTVTAQHADQGITIQMNSQQETTIVLDPIALTDYIVSRDPQAKRLLEEIQNQTQNSNESEFEQLKKYFQECMNQQFSSDKPVKFESQNMVKFVLNQTTRSYEVQQNVTKRRILLQRILFFGKAFGAIQNVVSNIVKTTVDLVKNHGPQIGAVTGAIAGLIISGGNPKATFTFAKIGFKIGTYAKIVLKGCVTSDYKIRCSSVLIRGLAKQQAKNYVLRQLKLVSLEATKWKSS